jgi:hypothetical protein
MKRFTDTGIWEKPWFRKLPPAVKELWRYLCDKCDAAGVIDPDWEAISFAIGGQVGPEAVEDLNGNAVWRNGKLFLPQFIEFQYVNLSRECRPHEHVFQAIEKHGLAESEYLRRPPAKPEKPPPDDAKPKNSKHTLEEVMLLAAKAGLPDNEAKKFFHHYESNGWHVGKNPMKSLPGAMANWKLRYEERKIGNGQAHRGHNPNAQMPNAERDPYAEVGRSIGSGVPDASQADLSLPPAED